MTSTAADLRQLLGTFYSRYYDGADEVLTLAAGNIAQTTAALTRLDEIARSLDRHAIPPLRRQDFTPLVCLRSEVVPATRPREVGEPGDSLGQLAFPVGSRVSLQGWAWPKPAGLSSLPAIVDRVIVATRLLQPGLDYLIEPTQIRFRLDPFTDPAFLAHDVYDDFGNVIDQVITLWGYDSGWDYADVHAYSGYLLGLSRPGTTTYRDAVAAILDMITQGPSIARLEAAISLVFAIPLAQGNERVEAIGRDQTHRLVVTDRAVYAAPLVANPLVAVGDNLRAGASIFDALQIEELTGKPPTWLRELGVPATMLASDASGGIAFPNAELPVLISTSLDNRTRIDAMSTGQTEDVEAFWAEVHRRGVASGRSLARRLDSRPDLASEPDATRLPRTLNPLKFVLENALRGGITVARIRVDCLTDRVDLGLLDSLRAATSPESWLVMELAMPTLTEALVRVETDTIGYLAIVSSRETSSQSLLTYERVWKPRLIF